MSGAGNVHLLHQSTWWFTTTAVSNITSLVARSCFTQIYDYPRCYRCWGVWRAKGECGSLLKTIGNEPQSLPVNAVLYHFLSDHIVYALQNCTIAAEIMVVLPNKIHLASGPCAQCL